MVVAPLHQDDRRLLHELDGRFERPGEILRFRESLSHQVPGHPRRGEVAGFKGKEKGIIPVSLQ
jgi:hypothetical protein